MLQTRTVFGCGAALLLAATLPACDESGVPDDARLNTLSSRELTELCSELRSNWPGAGETLRCEDGATVTLAAASSEECSGLQPIPCSVTAAQVRACNDALLGDPCGAFARPPEQCAALTACGAAALTPALGDCPPLRSGDLTPLEGVYQRIRHTLNAGSCAAEGESLSSSDREPLFVVVGVDWAGAALGAIRSCEDLAHCRALASEIRAQSAQAEIRVAAAVTPSPELEELIACGGENAGSWRAGGASVGSELDGMCRLTEDIITITRDAAGVLRLESKTAAWLEPATSDGCSYVAGHKPADAPCSELEVQEGRFLAPL
ncbi:MAG TPA: hypothetical protein VFS67_31915 [Polyangiaceae bacterium]|nr:hypothetical protein [Polyangiaceae bacterium]